MNATPFNVGAYVLGAPTSPRLLVNHSALLAVYADGDMSAKGEERAAYLSHFAFGAEMQTHYSANFRSVRGYSGPCSCRFLVLDIDRPDLEAALTDARRLVQYIDRRYAELEGEVPVYFSGSKGFHVLLELVHAPPPAVGFQNVCRALAGGVAASAGVKIDTAIYDVNHIVRLPNTRHPKTGLFKVRLETEGLFTQDLAGILETAKRPWANGIPTARRPAGQIETDWNEAAARTAGNTDARAAIRRDFGTAEPRAPKYFLDFLRFGTEEGERHATLFRCAAWLTENGAPPSLCFALLTEPGRDVGLTPADVARQIQCGIEHAARQRQKNSEGGNAA
ncbi:MAG: hypothetical protein U0791_14645 [Gemmataceae bacterium]